MRIVLFLAALMAVTAARAADNVLLIQLQAGGGYHVKAFVTKLGVIATLWQGAAKK